MKALILKDFYVLRQSLLLFGLFIVIFQAVGTQTAGIAVLYAALLPLSAFAYDDRSHWDELELMLPYSTRQIVLSRYCVGWISAAAFLLLGTLARPLSAALLHKAPDALDLPTLLAQTAITLCFISLSMPVYFRFDAEKSRLFRMIVLFVICAAIGGVIAWTGGRHVEFDGNVDAFLWPLYLLTAVLTAVSIPLSEWAWKRRHR